MEKVPTIRAACGAPLAGPPLNGAAVCPACASVQKTDLARRKRQRRLFWLVFLGAPFIAFAAAYLNTGLMIAVAALGSLTAGFLLAGSITPRLEKQIPLGIACSLGVAVVYLGLGFVGCLVAISGMH